MTGASISLYRIIQNIVTQNKYDIHILLAYKQGPLYDLLIQHNVKIYLLNKKNNGNIFKKLWNRAIYFPQYLFTLLHIAPSIVYANTLMNIGEVIIARMINIYTLVHAHEGEKFLHKYAMFIKLADYFTSEYIVVSNYALKSLQEFTKPTKPKHVVYNGIKVLEKKTPAILESSNVNISVIGTIDRNKSQLTAIQALALILQSTSISINLHLNLFGGITDNVYHQELLDFIVSKDLLNHVTFHGEVVDQNIMYEQTDLLVITSQDETFSLTALEAFNNSISVIASNVGGLPEVVENNVTGLLFDAENYQELSRQIERLIKSPMLRNVLINKAYQKMVQKFNIDLTVAKISNVIDRRLNDTY